jgi:hypothetical protein
MNSETEQLLQSSAPNLEIPLPSEPSPFIPGTNIQFALDSTSLGYFKTCPRLYQYSMIERWRPADESVHLTFGTLYHEALHEYDICRLDGGDHEQAVHRVVGSLGEKLAKISYPDVSEGKPSVKAKSAENLLRTVVWYLDMYPREKDPAQTFTLANGKPACELSFRFELDWGPKATSYIQIHEGADLMSGGRHRVYEQPYLLCGHLDRVVEFNGDLFVMDRKTTYTAPSAYYFNQFNPNNQMSLYTIAGKIVIGSPIRGVIIDVASVQVEKSEFGRGFTYRTEAQNEEWLGDLHWWTDQMEACASADYWPMNDTACDKFGGCRFRNICSKSSHVREAFLKSDFVRGEQWNPLKVR